MNGRKKIFVYSFIFLIGSVFITMGIADSVKDDPIIIKFFVHIASICGVALISGGALGIIIKIGMRVKYKGYDIISISNNSLQQLLCLGMYFGAIILLSCIAVGSSHLEFVSIVIPFLVCRLFFRGNEEFIILKDRILFFHSDYKLYVVDGIEIETEYYKVSCKSHQDKMRTNTIFQVSKRKNSKTEIENSIGKLELILKRGEIREETREETREEIKGEPI